MAILVLIAIHMNISILKRHRFLEIILGYLISNSFENDSKKDLTEKTPHGSQFDPFRGIHFKPKIVPFRPKSPPPFTNEAM